MVVESTDNLHDLFIAYNRAFECPEFLELFHNTLDVLQTAGVIHQLPAGNSVLLHPPYLDEYAAALSRKAGDDEDGLGRVLLEDPRFRDRRPAEVLGIPQEVRIDDRHQEIRLLQAMLFELEQRQLIHQFSTNNGKYVVLPTQCTRAMTVPESARWTTAVRFEGDGKAVLSSLMIRLLTLPLFSLEQQGLFTNGAIFVSDADERCGVFLKPETQKNVAEIPTFFEGAVGEQTKQLFLTFVSQLIISSVPKYESYVLETARSTYNPVLNKNVFVVCDSGDLPNVKKLAASLNDRDIATYFEEEEVPAGAHEEERKVIMEKYQVVMVALGSRNMGHALSRNLEILTRMNCRVIPIILPSAPRDFEMPHILLGFKAVDFRSFGQEPYDRLVMGILAGGSPQRSKTGVSNDTEQRRVELSNQRNKHGVRQQIFVSYCHNDASWLKRLLVHLKPIELDRLLDLWHDEKIKTGSDWREEINLALGSATAAILLISADFLASDFIVNDELPKLLSAAREEGIRILPLIVSPCRFSETPSLACFQSVNPPNKPLQKMSKVDQESTLVELSKTLESILTQVPEKSRLAHT